MAGCAEAGQAKSITLGGVLRAALSTCAQALRLPTHHWRVLRALIQCHTPALGGHHYVCTQCGKEHFVPNSCGNRHCPSCQRLDTAQWLEKQGQYLLPIPYFHVVFTLPHELNPLIQYNQALLYKLLFTSATGTLLELGRNHLQATLGITAVLHTWSQDLRDHYHLHCVVTAGGLSLDGKSWISRPATWLFSVRALSLVFRAKFRDGLQQLFDRRKLRFPKSEPRLADPVVFARRLRQICRPKWNVYAKRPFAGPEALLAYLCRYTHRVGITNSRIEKLDPQNGTVTFRYKDYAHQSQIRSMTLPLKEFLRRFCLHILPLRFVKIRYYGLHSNRGHSELIPQARALLAQTSAEGNSLPLPEPAIKHVEPPPLVCPNCGQPTLVLVAIIPRPKAPRPATPKPRAICDSS
jgi:hypothetical protein